MDKIQWHPAFCGATEWELKENKDDLEFEPEHNLSKKPLSMDMLVIKKRTKAVIKNEIGSIFRRHNIIEFKGEGDSLSIDDFYKGLGYASLYKSLAKNVNAIPAKEVTVTFIRAAYPRELFNDLKKEGMSIDEKFPGIYYVEGNTLFPVQVVVTKTLDPVKHAALRTLMSKADERDIRRFLEEAKDTGESGDHQNIEAVLHVSAAANKSTYNRIKGDKDMSEVLRDLMKEEIEEEKKDTKIEDIKSIMKNLKLTAEQAMDALEIGKEARKAYISML